MKKHNGVPLAGVDVAHLRIEDSDAPPQMGIWEMSCA
jgi:hypothetical protein